MEELLTITESSSPLPIRQIVEHVFKKNVELINLPQEKIDEYLSHILDSISQNRNLRSPEDCDKLRFLLVIMAVSLFPNPSIIPPISLNTNFGPLFSILLVLHMIRNDHVDFLNYYIQAFNKGLETFEYGFEVKTFYSISRCYYLQLLPALLKNCLKPEQFTDLLEPFFQSISRVKPETVNINFISFSADMFRQIVHHFMKGNALEMLPDFIRSFKEMLDICSSYPNMILLNLLYPFVKLAMDQKQLNSSYNLQDQIEQLTVFYEKVAFGKYHELHRGFPWCFAIYFYNLTKGREQQTRVLLLICHAFRSVLRLERMKGVREATNEIHSLMCSQRNSEGSWALFHILTSCESTLLMIISDIKKIHGMTVNPESREAEIKKRPIKFSEQTFENETNSEIDCELTTTIEELEFRDFESALECFNKQVDLLNTYQTRLMTGITFQFVFVDSILNDLQNEDNFTSSVGFYFITKIVKLGIKLMIVATQRITMLEQFNYKFLLTNREKPFQPTTIPSVSAKIPGFSIICKRYMEFTGRIPKQYYSLLAKEIAQMLYRSLEKGKISFLFIKYFSFLENSNSNNNNLNNNNNNEIHPQDTLYSHVLCKLMEIASSHLNDFMSHSATKSRTIFNWILFIIRIGKPNDSSYCHPCLKIFLRTFYKLIFNTIISNIKKTSNQIYALKVLRIYLHVMDGKYLKFRSVQRIYDEIQIFAKKDSLSPLLPITIPENDAINVPSLLSLLEASLFSDNPEIVKSASDFCLALFNPEKMKDSTNFMVLQLYKSWFESLYKLPTNEALQVIERLPEYSACFNQPLIPPSKFHGSLIHDETGFNLVEILNEIAFNMESEKDEVANLFTLVVDCFEILKIKIHTKDDNNSKLNEAMRILLVFLCYCTNFDFLKEKVKTFSNDILNYFVDVFAKGESSLFLISLISIAGSNRSESSKYAALLCITFFEKAKTLNVKIEYFKETVDKMMSFFSPQMRPFSMLYGLSLFIRYVPESVSLSIMRTFLISSNEFFILDIEFTMILNKMLKQFLNSKSREEQVEFVYMAYDILSHNLLNSSLIILKRIGKLGINLPIQNCNELLENNVVYNINRTNEDNHVEQLIIFQKLSAALMCGIESPIVLSDKMKQLINDFIKSKNDSKNSSRKMSLYMSIIRSPEIFKDLSVDPGFVKNVLSFFVNTLLSRIQTMRKNAAKAFRILVTRYDDEFYSSKQIATYCSNPSRIFDFFSEQYDRIAFYRRLTKIIPQKIPPSVIQDFLDSFIKYVSFNDAEKFKFLANLVQFVKYFAIENFVKLEPVRAVILSQYNEETSDLNYLQVFIEKIMILYQHREIPFHSIINKHVTRFLRVFPQETVDFIVQLPSRCDNKISYDFLTDLIESDDTHVFFNTFIRYIETCKEILLNVNHPSFFTILVKLSKNRNFANLWEFQSTLDGLLSAFLNNSIHNEASKRPARLFSIIMDIGYAELNTFRNEPTIERLFKFTQIFNLPLIINTHLYRRYVTIIFKKGQQSFIKQIVNFIMQTKPKITPKVFEILLGHSLKYLKDFDDEILTILWDFLSNKISLNHTNLIEPILVCIIRLLQKNVPHEAALRKILTALQWSISLADTHIVLYSIKLAYELVRFDLMPGPFYYQIVQQIFSYNKFFDLPYSKYTYKFLKMSCKYPVIPKEVEGSLIETISFFPHDKFSNVREMKRFVDIFTEVPQFLIGISFSLITTLALYLEASLKKKSKDEIIEIDPLLVSGLRFCSIVKPSETEIERYLKTCFLFIKFLIVQNTMMKDFPDTFFEYLLKNGCGEFPIELLNLISQAKLMNPSFRFSFISSASKFVSDELSKNEYFEIIEEMLQHAKDPNQNINSMHLIQLLNFIYSKSELSLKFYPTLSAIVDSWIELANLTDMTRDRFVLFCNGLIHCSPHENRMMHLVRIWEFVQKLPNIPSNKMAISSLFRFIIASIDYIPIHQQLTYLNYMIENIKDDPNFCFFFISVLTFLFDSERVSNQVKSQLLLSLSVLFTKTNAEPFEDVIDSLKKYGQKVAVDINFHIVTILLSQCKFSSHANRLIYYRRIMELIPNVTFLEFIKKLPLVFWSNDYLAITTALITADEWPIWCSIFAFSNRIVTISGSLALASLSKQIKPDNLPQVTSFFASILAEKPSSSYSQISIALLKCFHEKGLTVCTAIVEKAVKHSDSQMYLTQFLKDTIPSQYYLMPHVLNDSIFAHFLNTLNRKEASAIALTFLNEYQAAESIYKNEYSPTNSLFSAVMKVNSHFTSIYKINDQQSFHCFMKPLCSIGQENDSVLIKINEAFQLFVRKEGDPLEALSVAQRMNLKSLQKRGPLSLFEKERILTIEYSIRIIKRHFQYLKNLRTLHQFEEAVSPVFLLSLNSIKNFLDGSPQIQTPAIVLDNDGAVLLDSSLADDFPCVSTITSRGLLVIGKSQIDSYLMTMSLKISENQITAIDWCKFALFCFNVFLAQPSLDLFQVTFGVYSQIISRCQEGDQEFQPFIKIEAAARIITLIRIVIESSDADMAMIVTSNSGIFKREYFDIWKPWLIQIIDLAKSNWFCSIVSEIAKEEMYRSYLYCEKLGCRRIAETLNPAMDPITPLAIMNSLENAFNDFFFDVDFNKLYREVVFNGKVKDALEFKNSRRVPHNFFEYASTQIDIDELNIENEQNSRFDFDDESTLREFDKISRIVRNLNVLLPLSNPLFTLYRIYDDVRMFSPDFIVFYATTSHSSKEAFLVQRSRKYDKNGYSSSIITLSNIAFIFKRLFNACHQSRIRSINLEVSPLFEVGHKYTIVQIGEFSSTICLSTLFSSKVNITHQKWLQLKMKREKEESFLSSYERTVQEINMRINEANSFQPLIFSLAPTILLDYMGSMITKSDFLQIRPLFLRSFAAQAAIRFIFNAPYPKLERTFMSVTKTITPFLISDFEERFFNGVSSSDSDINSNILSNESSFRLSPNFTTLFGPLYRGEFLTSFASSMIALSSQIEILRACFEILVADPSIGNGGVMPSNLLMNRNKLEEKLLEASPPTGTMVDEEDCVEWFDKMMWLINQAENPEIQNPYSIPWF